ncbi:MAG: hypothetical protein ACOC1F_08485 [Myxococcota bacterium]
MRATIRPGGMALLLVGCAASAKPAQPARDPGDVIVPRTIPAGASAPAKEPHNAEVPRVVPAPGGTTEQSHDIGLEPVCDVTSPSAVALDMNGDGNPDVIKVMDGDRLRCRASDLNFDGVFDLREHYGTTGQTDRIYDLDFDGRTDRRVVDTDGDGRMDTWVQYDPSEPGCATVARDVDGDEKPDTEQRRCENP